ncbi:hypothetical protein BJ508DRAFT_372923 [Ascobolus immersus RN42]|uniref:RRM domain-containing protein n=1 Tax=Ascobolus immersus RN42 TaxID=1160509 RepID=A0A3N4IN70_ASCIM|nr:hypothetical protein BJ508DRAFT_372923 [Ascobolus immersus RN42]
MSQPEFHRYAGMFSVGGDSLSRYNSQESSSPDFQQTQFSPWTTNSYGSDSENWAELSLPEFAHLNPTSLSYIEAMQASQQAAADISASLSEMFTKMNGLSTNGINGDGSPMKGGDENIPTTPSGSIKKGLSIMRPPSMGDMRPAIQLVTPQEEGYKTTPTRHLVVDLTSAETFSDVRSVYSERLLSDGNIVVSFYDQRLAMSGLQKAQAEQTWKAFYCPTYKLKEYTSEQYAATLLENNGTIVCTVQALPLSPPVDAGLYRVLSEVGTVWSLSRLPGIEPSTYLVAFYDIRHASEAIKKYNGQIIDGMMLQITLYNEANTSIANVAQQYPMQPNKPQYHQQQGMSPMRSNGFGMGHQMSSSMGYGHMPVSSSYDFSPARGMHFGNQRYDQMPGMHHRNGYGFSTPSPQHNHYGNMVPRTYTDPDFHPHYKSQMVHYSPQKLRTNVDHLIGYETPAKNAIDLDEILHGLDTRTTVMLRNIPNKVDQATLKEYLDETSAGLYNFLYLRIDFKNLCNVGYAFINFIDPLDIVKFVQARSGVRWYTDKDVGVENVPLTPSRIQYNSDKVLDVTYANIQGLDQLIEKFRNSNVMDQAAEFRPKIYGSTPEDRGKELPFPPPNNLNRKLRSVNAAQHIGLFAPKGPGGSPHHHNYNRYR